MFSSPPLLPPPVLPPPLLPPSVSPPPVLPPPLSPPSVSPPPVLPPFPGIVLSSVFGVTGSVEILLSEESLAPMILPSEEKVAKSLDAEIMATP